jgi:hypothetical protein
VDVYLGRFLGREIPALLTALANMVSKKGVAEEGKVA